MSLVTHGFDDVTERALFSLSVSSADLIPAEFELGSRHFACFLAWDARECSVELVSAVAAGLLRAGASYFVCWGPDCERVHDIIDEVSSNPLGVFGIPDEACIMTTWHDSEPFDEALWFFLTTAWPDEHYFDSTRAAVAISVGSPEWALAISSALQDVRGFVGRVAASGVA